MSSSLPLWVGVSSHGPGQRTEQTSLKYHVLCITVSGARSEIKKNMSTQRLNTRMAINRNFKKNFFFLRYKNMTILIALVLPRYFQFLKILLLFSEWCSTTTRGVHPPSFQGQLISFHLRALDIFLHR